MSLWTIAEILEATEGTILSQHETACERIVMDSRECDKNCLFLCLPGSQNDGHQYIGQAISQGASIIIGTDKEALRSHSSVTTIAVDDVADALVKMALFRRKQYQGRLTVVTGSFGKTSTKEWIASICRHFGKTVATQKSYNSFPGVPFTLANIPKDADFAIIEIGMNHPGEIRPLADMCSPDVASITTIGSAHIEHMGSLEAIAEEKSDIFFGLNPTHGKAIFPVDLSTSSILEKKAGQFLVAESVGFGTSPSASIRLIKATTRDTGYDVTVSIDDQEWSYSLNLMGQHWIANSLCVIGVCHALGISVAHILQHIDSFMGLPGRGLQHLVQLKSGGVIRVLNDCYNAGPESMKAAIETLGLATIPNAQNIRKIAVLGDMYEQGEHSATNHRLLAQSLADNHIDLVYASGENMRHMFDALPISMRADYDPDTDTTNLAKKVATHTRAGDIILVKGSRGPRILRGRMSVIVDALLAMGEEIKPTTTQKGSMQNAV